MQETTMSTDTISKLKPVYEQSFNNAAEQIEGLIKLDYSDLNEAEKTREIEERAGYLMPPCDRITGLITRVMYARVKEDGSFFDGGAGVTKRARVEGSIHKMAQSNLGNMHSIQEALDEARIAWKILSS
jgi:hypothetical protein